MIGLTYNLLMVKPKRIWVTGNTGSGKTTVSDRVAKTLNLEHYELDAINWGPNWRMADKQEFRKKVAEICKEDRWVIDGNYTKARDLLLARVETILFLHPPLLVSIWRVLKRSLRRFLTQEKLWAGNKETLRGNLLSSNSLLFYALRSHRKRTQQFDQESRDSANRHISFNEFKRPSQIDTWLQSL
jgi:adenylate kinase family enzyme